ncbi:MAG: hypothetical protein ACUVS2_02120 [Candidatus Flexifilum sp.]|jgi:hypothetical protein
MRSIAPTRALTRRAAQQRTLAFFLGATGLLLFMIGLVLSVIVLVPPASSSAWIYNAVRVLLMIVGAVVIGAGIVVFVRSLAIKPDNQLALQVAEELGRHLDDSYTLVRNVDDREIGYVDAILVGPAGLCVFRILDVRGTFANEGASWLRLRPGTADDWIPAGIDPTVEVVLDVNKTREFFQKRLGEIPTWGIICFTRSPQEVSIMAKDPVVPSTHLVTLYDALRQNYLALNDRIAPEWVPQIVSLLVPA